jgi:hypothetical protein
MLREPPEFIAHVPTERGEDGGLSVAGVPVPRCVGRLPQKLYVQIDDALNAKAVAAGVNAPIMLDPDVWLLSCRRCQAPFIALPTVKLCSDRCRVEAKRDAVAKFRAKRVERGASLAAKMGCSSATSAAGCGRGGRARTSGFARWPAGSRRIVASGRSLWTLRRSIT